MNWAKIGFYSFLTVVAIAIVCIPGLLILNSGQDTTEKTRTVSANQVAQKFEVYYSSDVEKLGHQNDLFASIKSVTCQFVKENWATCQVSVLVDSGEPVGVQSILHVEKRVKYNPESGNILTYDVVKD